MVLLVKPAEEILELSVEPYKTPGYRRVLLFGCFWMGSTALFPFRLSQPMTPHAIEGFLGNQGIL